jgi:hypothetical protein
MVPWPHRVGMSPRPVRGDVDLRRSIGFGSKRVASANQSRPWESLVSALVGLPGVVCRRWASRCPRRAHPSCRSGRERGVETRWTRRPRAANRRSSSARRTRTRRSKRTLFLIPHHQPHLRDVVRTLGISSRQSTWCGPCRLDPQVAPARAPGSWPGHPRARPRRTRRTPGRQLRDHPGRGADTILGGRAGERPHPIRDVPSRRRRLPLRKHLRDL